MLIHGGAKGFVAVVFYGLLVAGLIPLVAWLSVVFMAPRGALFRLFLSAVFIMVYHYYLVGIAAHAEFFIYLLFQVMEVVLLLGLLKLFRVGGEGK